MCIPVNPFVHATMAEQAQYFLFVSESMTSPYLILTCTTCSIVAIYSNPLIGSKHWI